MLSWGYRQHVFIDQQGYGEKKYRPLPRNEVQMNGGRGKNDQISRQ